MNFCVGFETIITAYKGDEPSASFKELLPRMYELTLEQRTLFLNSDINGRQALNLSTLSMPLLDAHTPDILLFPIRSQAQLLKIIKQISLLNQMIMRLNDQKLLTFDASLSAENHDRTVEDIFKGYELLADRAKLIADRAGSISLK